MLEIRKVSKGYGKQRVCEDVSFTVQEGSIHALIGENSAGKTTLIKTLVGIYEPDEGEVLYDDMPVYDNPIVKNMVGYVADTNEYIPGYTVRRMVKFYKTMFEGFSEEKFHELNGVFQINDRKSIASLSKGQKMRLAFMLNLARHPKYLIMDEPTSGMDPKAKREFFRILVQEVEEHQMTVLLSSHHLGELEGVCDSVTMLKEGRTVVNNTIDEAKENYAKVQIVFKNGLPKDFLKWPDVRHVSNVGSIYTVVLSDYGDSLHNRIMEAGADLVEVLDISLEELFLYANEEVGEHGEE